MPHGAAMLMNDSGLRTKLIRQSQILVRNACLRQLKQPCHASGFYIHIDTAVSGIGSGTGH